MRVRGKATNVVRVMNSLHRTSEATDELLTRGIKDMADAAVDLLKLAAPTGRTRQLQRGIKARRRGARGIDVTIHAVAPETGYDYSLVTRFGHRVEEIVPTEGRKALRVRFQGGEVAYFNRVRGFKPSGDWVDKAIPAIGLQAEQVVNELGRELELRIFS